MFLISLIQVTALYSDSPQLKVTLMSQDPDPVEPGQIVTAKFKVENNGSQTSKDVVVKIMPKFPFTIYGDTPEKNIGQLKALATGADAAIVEFKLKVDDDAVEEDTELELAAYMGEAGVSYTNNEFLIDIQTHDAVLAITDITSEPSLIAPGSTGKVTIMVKNTADSLLKDIKFKLDMSGSSTPVAPYQSSSERIIAQLNSNFQQTLTFTVIAKPDAASGLYKVPLNISYNDEKGTSYTQTDVLAVIIGERPKINAYIKKSTVQQAGKNGKITLEIANAGNTNLKFLELNLLPSEDYQLITPSSYFYLGDVDSDDTESEEIEVYVNEGVEKLKLPVKLNYADANNQPFQQQFDLELQLYSISELEKFGVLEKSKVWIYVLIIILAVGGFFYYKKYWRKSKNGKGK
ncbi:hypothetical protein HZC30_06420 [Candidatus Woesearchaeota archaeon]|nr:hypothetical protein [Candidatus Woesearchaeota archaeon]